MKRIKGKPHYYKTIVNGKTYEYYIRKVMIDNKPVTITAKSKADYDEKYEAKKEALKTGADKLGKKNIKVKDVAIEYLKDSENRSSGTYIRREKYLRLYVLPEFKHDMVKNITHGQIKNFYNNILDTKKSITLVQSVHKVLNTMLDYCEENDVAITKNPIKEGILKSIRARANREGFENSINKVEEKVTPEDMMNILSAVKGTKEEIVYHLQILSGCRIAEALAMTFEKIDLENNLINISEQVVSTSKSKTKGTRFENADYNNIAPLKTKGSVREVPLTPPTRELVIQLKEKLGKSKGLLYTTINGKVCGRDNWNNKHHKPLMEKLGLNIKTHTLRKFFGSFHINNGTPVKQVQEWLGHSELMTTFKHYSSAIKQESNNKWLTAELVA
jgi:integrase